MGKLQELEKMLMLVEEGVWVDSAFLGVLKKEEYLMKSVHFLMAVAALHYEQ